MVDKNQTVENVVSSSSKTCVMMALQDSAGSKQSIHPLAPVGPPFLMKKYKLDNRPTAFKIISPLPAGLANVNPPLCLLSHSCDDKIVKVPFTLLF